MKLGYINSSKEEQARVLQVLKLTSESVALDELGIGRIRDAFADLMFPGTSTLQKHIKYFSLLPQIYKKAMERSYNRISEVRAEIIRLERIMTRNLCEGSPSASGITGSEMVNRSATSYVKYDPAYIYNSGLQIFGILKSAQLYGQIYAASNALHKAVKRYKSNEEDVADDATEMGGLFQFCSFPSVDYDFTKGCSLELTKEEQDFITGHILNAEACKGTLFRYFVDNPNIAMPDRFDEINTNQLPAEIANIQSLARKFADFVYILHIRYNYIFSEYKDKEMMDEFNEEVKKYKDSGTDITTVLDAVRVSENSCKAFCINAEKHMLSDNITEGCELDQCIIQREQRIKGSRRKIGNPSYFYDSKRRVHYYKLTYRWDTVRQLISELRGEVHNG